MNSYVLANQKKTTVKYSSVQRVDPFTVVLHLGDGSKTFCENLRCIHMPFPFMQYICMYINIMYANLWFKHV